MDPSCLNQKRLRCVWASCYAQVIGLHTHAMQQPTQHRKRLSTDMHARIDFHTECTAHSTARQLCLGPANPAKAPSICRLMERNVCSHPSHNKNSAVQGQGVTGTNRTSQCRIVTSCTSRHAQPGSTQKLVCAAVLHATHTHICSLTQSYLCPCTAQQARQPSHQPI